MGTEQKPIPFTAPIARELSPPGGETNAAPPASSTTTESVVTELRDGLLQDLIAVGLLLQAATDRRVEESDAADQAIDAARELIQLAPDKLRSAIERLDLR